MNYRTRRLIWMMTLVWVPAILFSAYMAVKGG